MHRCLSIIIPTCNEADEIGRAVASAQQAPDVEVLVVDGASTDRTIEIARRLGARILQAERGRACQMNAGAQAARGDVLLFLHADTRLPSGFEQTVQTLMAEPRVVAGAFRLVIDAPSAALRLIAAAANWRARRLQMPYGDQAIFLRSELFRNLGGYADLPFMEDFEFVRRLRRQGRIEVLSAPVLTSARRWQQVGTWRTTLINQLAIAAYAAGVSPWRIGSWYRRGKLLPF
jgi:rSAM/selenodomain-associated transferase 2